MKDSMPNQDEVTHHRPEVLSGYRCSLERENAYRCFSQTTLHGRYWQEVDRNPPKAF